VLTQCLRRYFESEHVLRELVVLVVLNVARMIASALPLNVTIFPLQKRTLLQWIE